MNDLKKCKIGVAFTGSFCTHHKVIPIIKELVESGAQVTPIFSEITFATDTRFGTKEELIHAVEELTKQEIIHSIVEVEPIGPQSLLDILVIAPCTGNTLAKMANGITDTSVLMAAKAMLRNEKPVVIALATNDALGNNLKNIGVLLNHNNVYFVPMGQDNYENKPNSMVAHMQEIIPTIMKALEGRQVQPILKSYY